MVNCNFLDCTLRDGGYYNQWHFKKDFTDNYLKSMEKIGLKNIEIGFRFFDLDEKIKNKLMIHS